MSARSGLAMRFAEHVRRHGELGDRDGVVVAVSGGLDSVVLLHLLRFAPGLPELNLSAAHLDHAMRPRSGSDAAWVRGLCSAWGVPLSLERLAAPPSGETAARAVRYDFLERARRERGARLCVTAHHADDQAETVLFRAVRDGEPRGLVGIRERREPGVWRPLLPFGRSEIRRYAEACRLTWREDETNVLPYSRNVLRHQILPRLEAEVAPAARRSLAALARRAAEEEEAWLGLEGLLRRATDTRVAPGGFSLDRDALLALPAAVRARLLRELARDLGCSLSRAGTRVAVEFTSSGASGRRVQPGGGLELRRDLGRILLGRPTLPPDDVGAEMPEVGEGWALARIGGRDRQVRWTMGSVRSEAGAFAPTELDFPLRVRGWKAGDRMRMAYGNKKVKKLLLEARIPASERSGVPVLVDGRGSVIWVPGVARSVQAVPAGDQEALTVEIVDADAD